MHETQLFQSATDAAQAVRRKEISSREITETLLAWIEATNPALNAVVELRPEEASREAAAADEATARFFRNGGRYPSPAVEALVEFGRERRRIASW